jgi:hypothetical protein
MKLRRNGRPDGRSKHASLQHWLREHAPLVHLGLYREPDDELATAAEHRRRSELEELARIRRAALACCIECHNPLLATEDGFQFCPYERAGQHVKVSQARNQHQVMAGRARARDAARDAEGRFAAESELAALARVAVGSPLRFDPCRAKRAAGDAALPRPSKTKG